MVVNLLVFICKLANFVVNQKYKVGRGVRRIHSTSFVFRDCSMSLRNVGIKLQRYMIHNPEVDHVNSNYCQH